MPENSSDKSLGDTPSKSAGNYSDKSRHKLTPEEVALIAGASNTESPGGGSPPSEPPPITVTGTPPTEPPPITVTGTPPTEPPPTEAPPPPSPPTGAHDPYSKDFDCSTATVAEKQLRNNLDALRRLANQIMSIGPGVPGGMSGYDNREYLGFAWRDPTGQEHASTLAVGDNSQVAAYTFASSQPGGPEDTLIIAGESIPFSQIIGSVHNHPSNSPYLIDHPEAQGMQPLPSVGQTNASGQYGGDYPSDKQLIDKGVPAGLLDGIFGEAVKGEGYQLRTYSYADPPPYDPNDSATWSPAYGPQVSNDINPCP